MIFVTNAEDLEKEASACITFNESKSHLPAPLPLEASTPDNASAADSEKMQESIEHNNNAELQPELTTMDPVSVPGSIGILDFGEVDKQGSTRSTSPQELDVAAELREMQQTHASAQEAADQPKLP